MEENNIITELLKQMADIHIYVEKITQQISNYDMDAINELHATNAEYLRGLDLLSDNREVAINTMLEEKPALIGGHKLLGRQKRILVIGAQDLRKNIMIGIAKSMGFEKGDFDFVEYDKAKTYIDRVRSGGRYTAIVFGTCPHKTSGGAGYSSALEKFKSIDDMPYTVDARSKSGHLKVTKSSFRTALSDICVALSV